MVEEDLYRPLLYSHENYVRPFKVRSTSEERCFGGMDTAAVVLAIPIFTYHKMKSGKAHGSSINQLKGLLLSYWRRTRSQSIKVEFGLCNLFPLKRQTKNRKIDRRWRLMGYCGNAGRLQDIQMYTTVASSKLVPCFARSQVADAVARTMNHLVPLSDKM